MLSQNQKRIDELSKIVCLAGVEAEKVAWLWPLYIAYRMITIIIGDPGVSKSTFALMLAALASNGGPMPFSTEVFAPIDVILLMTAEDDLAATIKPRLDAAGADCNRIHAFTGMLAIPDHLYIIEEAIQKYHAKMLIIDPLNAYLSSKLDGHKDQDVRQAMSRLKEMADTHGVAVVILHHMNKGSSRNALYRGSGSIGIMGAARSVLMVGRHPEDGEQRVLAHVKGNISKEPPSLSYRIVTAPGREVGKIELGEVVTFTSSDLLKEEVPTLETATKKEAAIAFLQRVLANGPLRSDTLASMAQAEGVAFQTYKNARKPAGVQARKIGDVWWSRLSSSEPWTLPMNDRTVELLNPMSTHEMTWDKRATVQEFHSSIVRGMESLFATGVGRIDEESSEE